MSRKDLAAPWRSIASTSPCGSGPTPVSGPNVPSLVYRPARPAICASSTVRQTLAGVTVWTPSDAGPLTSDAVTHTHFDDADRSTMRSVFKLLSGQVAAPEFRMP